MLDPSNDLDFGLIAESKPDAELLQMVYEFDKWGPTMLQAVEDELGKRNLLPPDVQERKQEMIAAEKARLMEGKQAGTTGLIVGWLTVLGLLGILIGYNYAFSKTKGKYGTETYYIYNEESRKKGTALFYTSIVLCSLGILYRLLVSTGTSV